VVVTAVTGRTILRRLVREPSLILILIDRLAVMASRCGVVARVGIEFVFFLGLGRIMVSGLGTGRLKFIYIMGLVLITLHTFV
jgi:hypothetical protein